MNLLFYLAYCFKFSITSNLSRQYSSLLPNASSGILNNKLVMKYLFIRENSTDFVYNRIVLFSLSFWI
jgi:hypothetical protein